MLLFTPSPVTVTLSPRKPFPSNALTLHHCFPPFSAKPISRNSFTCALTHSPTHTHVYPDPVPEFAEHETHKFKVELFRKLSEDDVDEFGDDLDAVVAVCAQVFIPLRGASNMRQAIKQCSMKHLTCHNLALLNLQTLRCSAKRDAMISASVQHVWNSLACICLSSLPETHHAVTSSVPIDHKDTNTKIIKTNCI
ncbi:protein PLASTID REDOX INSENSITIVE 2, chloroplastic isoform X1 [Glycine max]|uniref:protein PLASTID REDOX INSENSITIVE 2, chloroplastic isoform X1 n=1 Tax=Glycine max TaxID=3847 RepID=UPI001B356E4A|nr:protein PLASTID REDOX INSENSITIVE 2, chloroplastic isoform X1 [Glycine max]